MASLLPEGPLLVLSHLCSSAVLPGSFWVPGDGPPSHPHRGHRSIHRYACSFMDWPTQSSPELTIPTQLPSSPTCPLTPKQWIVSHISIHIFVSIQQVLWYLSGLQTFCDCSPTNNTFVSALLPLAVYWSSVYMQSSQQWFSANGHLTSDLGKQRDFSIIPISSLPNRNFILIIWDRARNQCFPKCLWWVKWWKRKPLA